jgi:hypothetical protein
MYMGSQGIYTHTIAHERDLRCPVCSAVPFEVEYDMTLQEVISVIMIVQRQSTAAYHQPFLNYHLVKRDDFRWCLDYVYMV